MAYKDLNRPPQSAERLASADLETDLSVLLTIQYSSAFRTKNYSEELKLAELKYLVMSSMEILEMSNFDMVLTSGFEEHGLQHVQSRHSHLHEVQNEQVSLPKADGGKDAWLFLTGCFFVEALTWGECICFLQP